MRLSSYLIRTLLIFVIFSVFNFTFCSSAFCQLDIPITISEAKPSDIPGLDRTDEPVSFGVPLKSSSNITEVNQLALLGSGDYQFRVLSRYPNGAIKWVLVDTLASVQAGGEETVHLTDDGTPGTAETLAKDNNRNGISDNNYITIDTGAAVFVIKKKNFNFLDTVLVDGHELIKPNTSKGLIVNDGAKEYTSSLDSTSITSIEENGPVKAVIKSEGAIKDGSGNAYLHYLVRLYFFRNNSFCRASVTLKNASDDPVKAKKAVHEFGVSLKINFVGSNLTCRFARESGEVAGSPPGYLFQGYVTKYNTLHNADSRELVTVASGLNINGTIYEGEASQGYAQIENEDYYVNAGMRFMGGYWPAGFEIESDGTIKVETYSKRNPTTPYIGWGQYQTREIIFEFSSKAIEPKSTLYKIQYPLVGRCDFQVYRDAGGVFGNTSLVSISAENQWLLEHGSTLQMKIPSTSDAMNVERKYHWASTGGFQNDWTEVDLINWLRTGNGVLLNRAKEAVRFRFDDSIYHSDNFSWKTNPPSISDNNGTYMSIFDRAHMFWESLPLLYYLTGNELIKDSLKDFAEWLDYESSATEYRDQFVVGSGDLRKYSRTFKALALLAEFLNSNYYLDIVVNMAKQYVTSNKRNSDRGYYDIACDGTPHALRDFFVTRIHADCIYQVWRVIASYANEKLLSEDLSDIMLGWGYFLVNEFIDEHGYTAYRYLLNSPNTFAPGRAGDVDWFLSHSYDLTGDETFLEKRPGVWLVAQQRGNSVFGERFVQSFIYRDINHNALMNGYINAVGNGRVDMAFGVTRSGSNYTLTWTVPVNNIIKYQIKFSDQPLVENLKFNQSNRTYLFNSNQYDNFWAALNMGNEPVPALKGSIQSLTVDVSQVIDEYNQRYGLQLGDSGYVQYDPNKNYNFAIKYWYSNSTHGQTDTTPPGDITNFSAIPGDGQITLSWTNPSDSDFAGVMIRYRTDTWPTDYNDGQLLCNRTGTPGSSDSFMHTGLQNETTYYYSAFTYDSSGNYSQAAHVSATPGSTGNTNQAPTASISASPTSGKSPLTVNFSGTGSDSDGTIQSYSWNFGDSTTSTSQNPTHTYARVSSQTQYTVSLTVTDDDGATAQTTTTITVLPDSTPPTAPRNFSVE